ncbi:MAG: hypothetical protein Q8O16_06180 [Dehalococcoidia bacterium]|nr:hypothetical protein [Dehalococcoidia bacterium]
MEPGCGCANRGLLRLRRRLRHRLWRAIAERFRAYGDLFGVRRLGTIMGMMGIAGGWVPPQVLPWAAIFALSHSYSGAFVMSSLAMLTDAVFAALLRKPRS